MKDAVTNGKVQIAYQTDQCVQLYQTRREEADIAEGKRTGKNQLAVDKILSYSFGMT